MHDCKGWAEVTLKVRLKVSAQFNSNYRSGLEVLEQEAEDEVISLIPVEFEAEILDVTIRDYKLLDAEREVEND